jgi:hypothetical protein
MIIVSSRECIQIDNTVAILAQAGCAFFLMSYSKCLVACNVLITSSHAVFLPAFSSVALRSLTNASQGGLALHDSQPRSIASRPRNIVYSAAGDHSSVLKWMACDSQAQRPMDFAIFISYYDEPSTLSEEVQKSVVASSGIFEYSKGYKMDLLFSAMQNSSYEYFFKNAEYITIVDDDLNFDIGKINLLFSVHKSSNLMLSTPSISAPGRAWKSNVHVDGCLFRRGAFVEIHSPTMSMDALRMFFDVWTPYFLVGFGTEHIIGSVFRSHMNMEDSDYGVIDAVQVANPELRNGTGQREIDTVMSEGQRDRRFREYAQKYPDQFGTEWIQQMSSNWRALGYGQCEPMTDIHQQEIKQVLQCS